MLGDSVSVTVTGNTLLVEGYGIIPDYPETGSSNPLYEYRDTIDTVIVDIGIERIGDNAFRDFKKLKKLTINEGVTEIGENAFRGCYMLSDVSVPVTVNKIGENAFWGCDRIIYLKNDSSIDLAEQGIISGFLFDVTKDTYKSFTMNTANACFSFAADSEHCYLVECLASENNVSLPEKVLDMNDGSEYSEYIIYNYAFADCVNIRQAYVPSAVTKIGDRAFYNCTLLTEVRVSGNADIGREIFMNTSPDISVICDRNSNMHLYAVENNVKYTFSDEIVYSGLQYAVDTENETYDVRFVATIKNLDYNSTGFNICAYTLENGEYSEINRTVVQTRKVFKTVYGMSGGTSVPVAEADGGEYLVALRVNNIPLGENVAFDITPFVETETNERINGETVGVYIYYGGGDLVVQYDSPVNNNIVG